MSIMPECLSPSNLIWALQNHLYPIEYKVIRYTELEKAEIKEDIFEPKIFNYDIVDVKPYIIQTLKYMNSEINKYEEEARKAKQELEKYKKEYREFEMFNKFRKENNGYL